MSSNAALFSESVRRHHLGLGLTLSNGDARLPGPTSSQDAAPDFPSPFCGKSLGLALRQLSTRCLCGHVASVESWCSVVPSSTTPVLIRADREQSWKDNANSPSEEWEALTVCSVKCEDATWSKRLRVTESCLSDQRTHLPFQGRARREAL